MPDWSHKASPAHRIETALPMCLCAFVRTISLLQVSGGDARSRASGALSPMRGRNHTSSVSEVPSAAVLGDPMRQAIGSFDLTAMPRGSLLMQVRVCVYLCTWLRLLGVVL